MASYEGMCKECVCIETFSCGSEKTCSHQVSYSIAYSIVVIKSSGCVVYYSRTIAQFPIAWPYY